MMTNCSVWFSQKIEIRKQYDKDPMISNEIFVFGFSFNNESSSQRESLVFQNTRHSKIAQ